MNYRAIRKFLSAHMRSLAAVVVIGWLLIGAFAGPYFGKISEISSNDIATFLPRSSESAGVREEAAKFATRDVVPAIIVFESDREISEAQRSQLDVIARDITGSGLTKGAVAPPRIAADRKAAFILVPLDSNSKFTELIPKLQQTLSLKDAGLTYHFTGPAMFSRDLGKAFAGIDGSLLIVSLVVVFIILLVVYRSPLLPVVALTGALLALAAAVMVVWYAAHNGLVQINGQVQGILFILVIGAATDYALLYTARYKEELLRHQTPWRATKAAWRATWEPIVAAGGTVTLGLLCLLVSDLRSNQALGPVGGIGIALAVLSALTFLPASLLLLGRSAFWPRMPRYSASTKSAMKRTVNAKGVWPRLAHLVGRHPRRVWILITVLLLLACVNMPNLRATGVSQENLIIGPSEARDGQRVIDRHFAAGSGSPAQILVSASEISKTVKILESLPGVEAVTAASDGPQGQIPLGRAAAAAGIPEAMLESKVATRDAKALLYATLAHPASSLEARTLVQTMRDALRPAVAGVMIGGVSAIQLDTNHASERDLRVIIPLILLAITIVLMILLRSIIAPLVLLGTTIVSFGAMMGIAAFMFNDVWRFAGADPAVIIFSFVFLVALGIDYNIFLMTRVREEVASTNIRTGTLRALIVTGGVITSAGIVLASTFAALYVIPILFLVQIAFIVAVGVLLDTLIVRSLLVPALALEIGPALWWPSALHRKLSGRRRS